MAKINEKLLKEILEYCELNEISDTEHFINKMLRDAFTIEKFGSVPNVAVKPKRTEEVAEEKKENNDDIYNE